MRPGNALLGPALRSAATALVSVACLEPVPIGGNMRPKIFS